MKDLPETSLHERIQMLWDNRADTQDYVRGLLDLSQELASGNADMALIMLREACQVAGRLGELPLIVQARVRLAWQLYRSHLLDQALVQASYAESAAQHGNLYDLRYGASYVIALIRGRVGDYEEAERIWKSLISDVQAARDRSREADYLTAFAGCARQQGHSIEALHLRLRAHEIYLDLNDKNLPGSFNNVAMAMIATGRLTEAHAWAEQGLAMCEGMDVSLRCLLLHTLSLACLQSGEHKKAIRNCDDALALLSKSVRDPRIEAMLRIERGRALHLTGDTMTGIEQIEAALGMVTKIRDAEQTAAAHRALHAIYTQIGAFDEALKHCNKQSELLRAEKQEQFDAASRVLRAQRELTTLAPAWQQDLFGAAPVA